MNIAQTSHFVAKKLIHLLLLSSRSHFHKQSLTKMFIDIPSFTALIANMVGSSTDESTPAKALEILQINLNAHGYQFCRCRVGGETVNEVVAIEELPLSPLGCDIPDVADMSFLSLIDREHFSIHEAPGAYPGAVDGLNRNPNAYAYANTIMTTRG